MKEVNFDINKQIPNLTGSKNRYWRIITAHLHQTFSAQQEREQTHKIIHEGNHKTITPKLYNELHKQNLYPTRATLQNILTELNKPLKHKHYELPLIQLDYSYAGDGIIKPNQINGRTITHPIQIGTKEFIDLKLTIPTHLDLNHITRVTKPVIYVDKDAELSVRYSVVSEQVSAPPGDGILGCDLGRLKPITCASVKPNGEYSRELTASRELERVNEKLARLSRARDSLFKKKESLSALLSGSDNPSLVRKLEVLEREYSLVRGKASRVREHLGWLSARDVVDHALFEGCRVVHLEHLSWVGSMGGKWAFADAQAKIEFVARQEGVRVAKVDAHGTSWELPVEYLENPAPRANYDSSSRLLSDGSVSVDKDYAASVSVACRVERSVALSRKQNSRERVIQPSKCRDKDSPTPRRPRRRVRSGCVPKVKKTVSYPVSVGASMTPVSDNLVTSQVMINSDNGVSGSLVVSANDP